MSNNGAIPPPGSPQRAAMLAALLWQIELGVDEAVTDAPIDRRGLADAPRPRALAPAPASPATARATRTAAPKRGAAPAQKRPPPMEPAENARNAAARASDLVDLKAAVMAFDGSRLKDGAKNCVFADGDPAADLMVIGEAPGAEEDRQGLPFVGRSGVLLDRMLTSIGLSRHANDPASGAYITNIVPYRPLGNRPPDDAEAAAFAPFMLRHIALAAPRAVLCLGNAPAKHVMGAEVGVTRFRGAWKELEIEGRRIPALSTFHPAYLLRSPDMKRYAWRDLLELASRLAR
ncbi:MAG: uracil-DNA glycosylase [Neomegalonema sp.]|nr:uracil-DNA glycosylase [Neomegalonema sp.]